MIISNHTDAFNRAAHCRSEDRNIPSSTRGINCCKRISHSENWNWSVRAQSLSVTSKRLIEHEITNHQKAKRLPSSKSNKYAIFHRNHEQQTTASAETSREDPQRHFHLRRISIEALE